ncbi:MAG TPA: SWIM zinc finger family protein [Anaerolineae bacterium]|nr:SWIM zinc finger family protein [Anaerolineae bacterium]
MMSFLDDLAERTAQGLFKGEVWRSGFRLLEAVRTPIRQGDRLAGRVYDKSLYTVMIELEDGAMKYRCDCADRALCAHVAALWQYWYRYPSKVEEVTPTGTAAILAAKQAASHEPAREPLWLDYSFADIWAEYVDFLQVGLKDLRVDDLRQWAKRAGWVLSGARKEELLEQVYAQWSTDLAGLNRSWQMLGEKDKVLWQILALIGDYGRGEWRLLDELQNVALTGSAPRQWRKSVGELEQKGLLLLAGHWDYIGSSLAVVPSFVKQALPAPLSHLIPVANVADFKGEVQRGDPHRWLHKLQQVMQIMEKEVVPLGELLPRWVEEKDYSFLEGWPYSVAEVMALAEENELAYVSSGLVLEIPMAPPKIAPEGMDLLAGVVETTQEMDFIYSVLKMMDLVCPGTPVKLWSKSCLPFWEMSLEKQWAFCLRTLWLRDDEFAWWGWLRENKTLKLYRQVYGHYKAKDIWKRTLYMARRMVLHVLSCLPEKSWVAWDDIRPLFWVLWPELGQDWRGGMNRYLPDIFVVGEAGYLFETATDEVDWETVQGAFVQSLIMGPLHWLGVTDIVVDEAGELEGFCVQGLKTIFWEQAEVWPLPAPLGLEAGELKGEVVVGEEKIRITAGMVALARPFVAKIAQLEKATVQELVYVVDAATVWQSFEQGVTLAQLEADWEKVVKTAFTGSIPEKLRGWWANYGQVRLYKDVTVIRFSDSYARQEMGAVTSLEEKVMLSLSPQVVVVSKQVVAGLIAELEGAGYQPKLVGQVTDE